MDKVPIPKDRLMIVSTDQITYLRYDMEDKSLIARIKLTVEQREVFKKETGSDVISLEVILSEELKTKVLTELYEKLI